MLGFKVAPLAFLRVHVEANVDNWVKLFSDIDEYANKYGLIDVELTDSKAGLYEFQNEMLTWRMRKRLVETLQRAAPMTTIGELAFGNKFFRTMNEQQQRSFFHSIFNLPISIITVGERTDNSTESPAITIGTSALLETLPQLHTSVCRLIVSNFALTCQSDIQAMANIIVAKCATFKVLGLEGIECPVDDCNRQYNDESDGFLDPLLYAASGLEVFHVSTKARSDDSPLVSPSTLRALFVEGKRFRALGLRGLGLTDSHVLAIVDSLSTPGTHLDHLALDFNPGISAQGYDALFNLINRANVFGNVHDFFGIWSVFNVDDMAWEGELNLVSEMNSKYSRLEYLTNGTFTSEERRWEWLERVANLPGWIGYDAEDEHLRSSSGFDARAERFRSYNEDKRKETDAKHLNFLWYTLRQNPEMMHT